MAFGVAGAHHQVHGRVAPPPAVVVVAAVAGEACRGLGRSQDTPRRAPVSASASAFPCECPICHRPGGGDWATTTEWTQGRLILSQAMHRDNVHTDMTDIALHGRYPTYGPRYGAILM